MSGGERGKTVLVTGGGGYIGSHCILQLLEHGFKVVAVDNFENASKGEGSDMPESLVRAQQMTGGSLYFETVDIRDKEAIRNAFQKYPVDCVIHIAALKAVGESMACPIKYYETNVLGSVNLVSVMNEFGVKRFVFSSSSTVFGDPTYLPIDEKHPTGNCTNPYGRTKYIVEEFVKDVCRSDPEWQAMLLRYFNPVGAHSSGIIGEDPLGVPNNLVPFIAQVAVGRREKLTIFGTDYPTPDGTCIRDYIHIVDLADGHVAALANMFKADAFRGFKIYNLSTGSGASVLDVIRSFEKASGVKIPIEFSGRRLGDIPATYAKGTLAEEELGWKAEKSLDQMCEDAWKWQSQNPFGYRKSADE